MKFSVGGLINQRQEFIGNIVFCFGRAVVGDLVLDIEGKVALAVFRGDQYRSLQHFFAEGFANYINKGIEERIAGVDVVGLA